MNINIDILQQIKMQINQKRQKRNNKLITTNVLKYGLCIALIFVAVLCGTYAYFNYTKVDSRQANIAAGELYVKLVEDTTSISLPKMYPRTDEEARSRDDNYFDFTISVLYLF